MSSKINVECGGKIVSTAHARAQRSTTKLHGWPNEYNIMQHPGKQNNVVSYNICLVKSLIVIKLQNTTRYNKVAKRMQHFIQHQSCMMLYEMLYSFGRGLKTKFDTFQILGKEEFSK